MAAHGVAGQEWRGGVQDNLHGLHMAQALLRLHLYTILLLTELVRVSSKGRARLLQHLNRGGVRALPARHLHHQLPHLVPASRQGCLQPADEDAALAVDGLVARHRLLQQPLELLVAPHYLGQRVLVRQLLDLRHPPHVTHQHQPWAYACCRAAAREDNCARSKTHAPQAQPPAN
jgi:hypothetical protein